MSSDEAASTSAAGAAGGDDSKDQFTDGIMTLLRPVVSQLDDSIKATRESQVALRLRIDLLAEDLRRVSDGYKAPYDLESYVRKLNGSKKRVAVVGSILQNAQDRLEKLQKNITKETDRRLAQLERAPTPPP